MGVQVTWGGVWGRVVRGVFYVIRCFSEESNMPGWSKTLVARKPTLTTSPHTQQQDLRSHSGLMHKSRVGGSVVDGVVWCVGQRHRQR